MPWQSSSKQLQGQQTEVPASLSGGAGAAHGLLKTLEKNQGKSFEEVDDIRAQTQGPNVRDRMTTRICAWASGKWNILSRELEAETQEAWLLLGRACADPELPKHKIHLSHLRNVLKAWPAKAGLGIDLWMIKLWSQLPDEGLRVLIRIMYLALDGIVPMQLLLVLIGLLPKEEEKGPSHSLRCSIESS